MLTDIFLGVTETDFTAKVGVNDRGQVAQLVRPWSQYSKVAGSILGQGTYKNQPVNA